MVRRERWGWMDGWTPVAARGKGQTPRQPIACACVFACVCVFIPNAKKAQEDMVGKKKSFLQCLVKQAGEDKSELQLVSLVSVFLCHDYFALVSKQYFTFFY